MCELERGVERALVGTGGADSGRGGAAPLVLAFCCGGVYVSGVAGVMTAGFIACAESTGAGLGVCAEAERA